MTEEKQVVAPANFSLDFTDEKLYECLDLLHGTSRITKAIELEEGKLKSLVQVRDRLNNDPQRPVSTVNNLISNMNEIQEKIRGLKSEINAKEQKIVQAFQDILLGLSGLTEERALFHSNQMKQLFNVLTRSFIESIATQIRSQTERLTQLDQTKMSLASKKTFDTLISNTKANVIDVHQKGIRDLTRVELNHYKSLSSQVEDQIKKSNPENWVESLQKAIQAELEPELKSYLAETRQNNNTNWADQIMVWVHEEIESQIGGDRLNTIISGLPEFQEMRAMAEQFATERDDPVLDEFETLKEVVGHMNSELNQLKQLTVSTRSVVDHLKEAGLPSNSVTTTFDYEASLRYIKEVEQDIQVVFHHIKVVEAVVTIKSKAVETSNSRKRKFQDEEDNEDEFIDSAALKNRIESIEENSQMISDFLDQYNETLLSKGFSVRLQNAMKKIHQTLSNHERFIAFLINPFSDNNELPAISFESKENDFLHPAMIDSISELIKKTAEEISLPLQRKIQSLEEKLNAKR